MVAPTTGVPWHEAVRATRLSVGMSQERWAAEVFVSRRTVQRWERGEAIPDAASVARMVAVARECGWFSAEGQPTDGRALVELVARARGAKSADVARSVADAEHLVGRHEDVALVCEHLHRFGSITVTGPGGIGKTALADAVADRGEAGRRVVFVDLLPVAHLDDVFPAIVQATIGDAGRGDPVERATAALSQQPTLLLLDAAEDLADAASAVTTLVSAVPELQVLVTSRVAIGYATEQTYLLGPLATDDAVALFSRRAQQVLPTFAPDAVGITAIEDVCRAVDGIPLAIELAAARVRLLPPERMVERLDRELSVLSSSTLGLPARQRTMAAVIEWSHGQLDDGAQHLLARLSVLHTFDLAAAEAVGDGLPTLDALDALLDADLVKRLPEVGGLPRFRCLHLVQVFAAERLRDLGEETLARLAAARHFGRVARGAATALRGPDASAEIDVLLADDANLRRSLAWLHDTGHAGEALRLAVALSPFWDATGAITEARRWLRRLVETRAGAIADRAAALSWAAYFAHVQLDLGAAAADAERALELWAAAEHEAGSGYPLLVLGQVAAERGRARDAVTLWRRSLAALEAGGDDWGAARALNCLAEQARVDADLDAAARYHHDALQRVESLGDRGFEANVRCGLGRVHLQQGDIRAARQQADAALALARPFRRAAMIAPCLELLGLAILDEMPDDAVRAWGEAAALRAHTGAPLEARDRPALEAGLGQARQTLGDHRVERLLDEGAALFEPS